jgi:H(+)-translocating pyrophosphatase
MKLQKKFKKYYFQFIKGALTFLTMEYFYLGIFLAVFAIILVFIDGIRFYTCFAFILGAATSVLSGFIGMYVATRTNVRVTYMAYHFGNTNQKEEAYKQSFNAAFRGGCVMGFFLVSLALLILTLVIIMFRAIMNDPNSLETMFEYISGYGLGGSTVALFCRVGGGIYTKAADVGADLVGKNELDLPEDSPENPATIADNVGDNVGDIAGMGSDLFGSFAESTCAALVVSGTCPELLEEGTFMFPLILSASGILVCIITSFFATNIMIVTNAEKIERTLQWQLIISTVLLTPTIIILSLILLPDKMNFEEKIGVKNYYVLICTLSGLYAGFLIGFFTDYYTSKKHGPTIELALACKSGAAINIIHGLSLGYVSCIIPIIAICRKYKI